MLIPYSSESFRLWPSAVCSKRENRPLVSIITVVLNAATQIEATLNSVLTNEGRCYCEILVIDGGSTDGTLELLRAREADLDYWSSEPDGGIYHAMTKGVALAQGMFIYHLNVGDRLLNVPVDELCRALNEGVDIAAFRVSVDGRSEFVPRAGKAIRFSNTLHHQGTFYRRESFPGYDLSYRVLADFDLNQRMLISGARVLCFDNVVALHSSDGVSNRKGSAEFFSIIRKNCGALSMVVAWMLCKIRGARYRLQKF
jgi:glycosyltransferase involved in cell wall biosynthesis